MGLLEEANYEAQQIQEKNKRAKQREEDKKNSNFIQLYRNQIDNLSQLAVESPTALKVFLFLVKHMDGSNALMVSNVALSEALCSSRPTINRAIKHLKDNGWICILKSGNSNVYVINPEVAWTSYGYQKQYCKFNATVILSGTENSEVLDNPKAFTKYKTIDETFIRSVREKEDNWSKFIEMIEQDD